MSATKLRTGGPAFPVIGPGGKDSNGMTLRDYFAAAAMQSIMNSKFYSDMRNDIGWQEIGEWHYLSEECYGVADAMMEARK